MSPSDSYSRWVGLENHLNYVYRQGSELKHKEARGLAAFFNSVLVDRYFRAVSGNTQVNAAEIRTMPFPDEETLTRIGEDIDNTGTTDSVVVERIVGTALHLSSKLIRQLVDLAQ